MPEWVIWPTRSQRHFAAVPFKLTKDLTDGYGWYVYHSNDYTFSCLAQREDGTYYLISCWNGMRDEKVQDFLLGLDVYNAIRLDGGTSTSMCYETDLVEEAE